MLSLTQSCTTSDSDSSDCDAELIIEISQNYHYIDFEAHDLPLPEGRAECLNSYFEDMASKSGVDK